VHPLATLPIVQMTKSTRVWVTLRTSVCRGADLRDAHDVDRMVERKRPAQIARRWRGYGIQYFSLYRSVRAADVQIARMDDLVEAVHLPAH
jgi:hypothetical protein